ncbi:hypothetical protein ABE85_08220 [Mitsuaria sp. 7]|nr:hypothetical protein ABE85_08220 [Mitsuaria sp. 7]
MAIESIDSGGAEGINADEQAVVIEGIEGRPVDRRPASDSRGAGKADGLAHRSHRASRARKAR